MVSHIIHVPTGTILPVEECVTVNITEEVAATLNRASERTRENYGACYGRSLDEALNHE